MLNQYTLISAHKLGHSTPEESKAACDAMEYIFPELDFLLLDVGMKLPALVALSAILNTPWCEMIIDIGLESMTKQEMHHAVEMGNWRELILAAMQKIKDKECPPLPMVEFTSHMGSAVFLTKMRNLGAKGNVKQLIQQASDQGLIKLVENAFCRSGSEQSASRNSERPDPARR